MRWFLTRDISSCATKMMVVGFTCDTDRVQQGVV